MSLGSKHPDHNPAKGVVVQTPSKEVIEDARQQAQRKHETDAGGPADWRDLPESKAAEAKKAEAAKEVIRNTECGMEAKTEDALLEIVTEAGPRAFTADLPLSVRLEIAKSTAHGPYREACKQLAQDEVALIHLEIEFVSKRLRRIENTQEFKACNGFGYPQCSIPKSLWDHMEHIYGEGCWEDDDFMDDVLKHHPGLRIRVTRGTRGQEYAGRGRR